MVTTEDALSAAREAGYLEGRRQAWLKVLDEAIHALTGSDVPLDAAKLLSERQETIVALREVCGEWGDNDWDESLHLADVVDKHLGRHLTECAEDAVEDEEEEACEDVRMLEAIRDLASLDAGDWPGLWTRIEELEAAAALKYPDAGFAKKE